MHNKLAWFQDLAKKLDNVGVISEVDQPLLHPFDTRNIHPDLVPLCLDLFDNGHYSQTTFEAFKYLDKKVETVSQLDKQGRSLMMATFNENNPIIQLNDLTDTSETNEQEGYKYIFAGAIIAIRNPRGHDYGKVDTIEDCLDHLSLASQLLRVIDERVKP